MENIELLDKETQLLIAESLSQIAIELRKTNDNNNTNVNEIKNIFMHFFTAISTLEKTVSDEYIMNLNNVINDYAVNNFRINIDSSLIEYANTLGKFGQTVKNRQFSAFLCICLLRIAKNRTNDIDNRLLFLCNDNESAIKYEMSYQIRFIINENDSEYCSKNLLETINHFLTQSDLAFCSIFIESMLYKDNITKLNKQPEIVNAFVERVNQIFNIDDFCILKIDFGFISTIFVNVLSHAYDDDNKRKMLVKGIKMYLMNYFIVYEKKNSANSVITLKIEHCLENLYKIIKVFILEKDKQFVNDIVNVSMKYFFKNEINISLLYNNLHMIIKEICSEQQIMTMLLTKVHLHKIFFFFDIDEVVLNSTTATPSSTHNCIIKTNNNNNNNSNSNVHFIVNLNTATMFIDQSNNNNNCTNTNSNSVSALTNNNNKVNANLFCDFNENWYKHINKVTKTLLVNDNNDFVLYCVSKLQNIFFIIKKTKSWRIQKKLINMLNKFPQYLLFNYTKYPNYEESMQLMFNLCKDLLTINRNIQIETQICKLITQLVLFSTQRNEILSYMKNTFLCNTSFYRRRIYCFFIKYAMRTFSIDFLKKKQIYTNAVDVLLNGEIPLIQTLIINALIVNNIYDESALKNIQAIQQVNTNDNELQCIIKMYLSKYNNEHDKENRMKIDKQRKVIELKVENIEKEIEESSKKDEMLFKRPKTKQRTPASNVLGIKKTKTKVCSSKEVKKFEEMGKVSVTNKKQRKTSMNNNNNNINDIHSNNNNNTHVHTSGINLSSSVNITRPKKNIGSTTSTNSHYTSHIVNARTSFKSPYSSKK